MDIMLLGMDFLTHYDCIINLRKKVLVVGDLEIKFMHDGDIYKYDKPIKYTNNCLIKKIISNILTNPNEQKFKSLNLCKLQEFDQLYLKSIGLEEIHDRLIFIQNINQLHDVIK